MNLKLFYTSWERIFYWLGKNLLLVGKESYFGGKEIFTGLGKDYVMLPLKVSISFIYKISFSGNYICFKHIIK